MKLWKTWVLFYVGGMVYAGLELLWRGWTHGSMFVLGGLCFVLIGALNHVSSPLPLPIRMIVAAGIVTMLELGCGLLCNRAYQIWDYRHLPLNYHGQICLPYTMLWIPVSLAALVLYDRMERGFEAHHIEW